MLKKTRYFNAATFIGFALLVSSCAQISTVKTNLDKENFEHYFSPGQVTIYAHEKDIASKHQLIGMVEGENCQAKPHLAMPNKIEARTQARRNAYQLGANGIVFSGCAEISTKQCHAMIVCYGKAYQIEQE
ncbi:rcsF protein [Thalassotalea sp. M1531]|uniref:RcsF protein n=1 Tax=Thalassotalea algicola TaxID=2716224 RepID=A0A7Y0LF71_9GAMM|nr:Rcs stress response system protein RcsF [Thalassotalea algicola]NMP33418.1 rcsF protein [Thalassotalea algicola]